jgi:hypothetical protein
MRLFVGYLLLAVGTTTALAQDSSGSYSSGGSSSSSSTLFEGGITLHSGNTTTSMAGSSSTHAALGAMSAKGAIRFYFRTEAGLGTGLLNSESTAFDEVSYQAMLIRGAAGLWLSPFSSAGVQPMLGAGGIGGWQLINSSEAPIGESPSALGFHYGYEINAGVLLSFGSRGKGLLIRTSYSSVQTKYASKKLDIGGLQLSLGWLFGR